MADRYQDRPFPADGFGRGGDHARAEADPLAELARLIGQTDPQGQGGRSAPRAAVPPRQPAPSTPLEDDLSPPPGPPTWMQRANPRVQQPAAPRDFGSDLSREPQQRPTTPPAYPGTGSFQDQQRFDRDFPEQDFDSQDQAYHQDQARQEFAQPASSRQQYGQQDYSNRDFADEFAKLDFGSGESRPHAAYDAGQDLHREPAFDEQEPDPSRYDDALFGQIGTAHQDYQDGQEYHEDHFGYQDGYDDAEDEEPPKRRSGMLMVFAVLALAVVGTGGAFAYKTYFSTSRSGEPPIIRADNSPTKIMASPADSMPKVPDRLPGGDGGEKLVSREETPVDVNARSAGPRVVFPPPPSTVPPSAMPASTGAMPSSASASNGTLPNGDPRPISTLRISGNPPDASGAAPAAPPATKQAAAAKSASSAHGSPVNANASANNVPLSLTPQGAAPAPAAARVASVAPDQTPVAAPSSGGYLVSVSSQVSESDAVSSYKALQGKYPSVLGSYAPVIKRTDLGEKGGIRYRAAVGPFPTKDEANQMCGSLKSAGGQCFAFAN
jgi:hypothetical protein